MLNTSELHLRVNTREEALVRSFFLLPFFCSMENPDENPDTTDARLREAQQRTMERLIRGIEELTDRIGRLEIQIVALNRGFHYLRPQPIHMRATIWITTRIIHMRLVMA